MALVGYRHLVRDVQAGPLALHLVMDVEATLSSDGLVLSTRLSSNRSTYSCQGGGTGVIAFAGLAYAQNQTSASEASLGAPEWWTPVESQMRRLSDGTVPDDVMWGVYASDDTPQTSVGVVSNPGPYAMTFTDATDEWRGGITLLRLVTRTVTDGTATLATDDSLTVTTDDLKVGYYPFAQWRNDRWESCNRDGGSLKVMRGGEWGDAKNDVGDEDDVFLRKSPFWEQAKRIGWEYDE